VSSCEPSKLLTGWEKRRLFEAARRTFIQSRGRGGSI
jgi:hypothetical protein